MDGESAGILADSAVGMEWIASPEHHPVHFPIQRALVEPAGLQVQLSMQSASIAVAADSAMGHVLGARKGQCSRLHRAACQHGRSEAGESVKGPVVHSVSLHPKTLLVQWQAQVNEV